MNKQEKNAAFVRHFGKRPMVLQLMNDELPPAATPPAGDGSTPPPADDKDKTPPPAGDDKKPFATFPDEKSFMSRVDREAKKQREDFLKSIGVDDEETLKTILAANKERQDADQKKKDDELSESQKLQKQIDALEIDKSAALTRAETMTRNAEAKQLAAGIGISPSRINHFIKLADISDIKVNADGTVDLDTMKTRFATLAKELPEFKGQSSNPQGGGDFGGPNNNKISITKESIKSMTANEIAANIVEVRKVMEGK